MPYKVVYNTKFGGAWLSEKAIARYNELSGKKCYCIDDIESRHCPYLIQVIEEMGNDANGMSAKLAICEIDEKQYWIQEYDGCEKVETIKTIPWVTISQDS